MLLLVLPSAFAATPALPETTAATETIEAAFPPPAGAHRLDTDAFGAWLRQLPLWPAGHAVTSWQGAELDMPAARVVSWSVAGESALQCADTALRLRATWERSVGESPAFHYTSGDLSRWDAWAAGTRPSVKGNTVTWVAGAAKADRGDTSFTRWLTNLYQYAGTYSLPRDTVPVSGDPAAAVRPGDVLVAPGSPGHAVVILDVATDGARTWVLAGQGYMPAMELHVVDGPDGGWYPVAGDVLPTEPIPLAWSTLRRWK